MFDASISKALADPASKTVFLVLSGGSDAELGPIRSPLSSLQPIS